MEFSRQEYWSGLPFPSPGDLPDTGIKPRSPALQAEALPLSHQGSPYMQNLKRCYELTYLQKRTRDTGIQKKRMVTKGEGERMEGWNKLGDQDNTYTLIHVIDN